MSGGVEQLFVSPALSDSYKRYRPQYPTICASLLREYAAAHRQQGASARIDSALDIAAGSGQFTRLIAPLVREGGRIVALDVSPTQVAQGRADMPAVSWVVGSAECTGLEPGSFELVTVAEAMHWMDIPAFYTEAHRLLAPGGVICVVGYAGSVISDHAAANAAFYETWEAKLGPYWDPKKQIIEDQYVGHEPPPALFEHIVRHDSSSMPGSMWMEKQWGVDDTVGFCESWSGYRTYCERHGVVKGSADDPAVTLRADLEAALASGGAAAGGASGRKQTFTMKWPLVMLLATKREVA